MRLARCRRALCLTVGMAAVWTLTAAAAPQKPASSPPERDGKAWAYRTPTRPALPAVKDPTWVRNPIDAFVLARLEASNLTPAAPADRVTLIRRLTFDLTGLPPTPAEIDAFVRDPRPDAYERLVERLLASPQYGEHWATYWLDLVRFAESNGFKSDEPRPLAWRYRDYVIAAFNRDKPYDRFVREQLAGDELYPDDADALVATGFCRHFPDESNAVNLEERRQDILNDITDTTGSVFLGLTVGCARCHDHKFDPILQSDYYRLQAFFAAFQPAEVPVGDHAALERFRREERAWEEETAELRKKMAALEEPVRKQFEARRKVRFPREYQAMYELPPDKRSPLEQQIAAMVARQVEMTGDEVAKSMKPDVRERWQQLGKEMASVAHSRPRMPEAMVLTDVGPAAPPTHLLRRGDWRHKDREILPGYPSAIEDCDASLPDPSPGSRTTGRRSVLAQWLTRPDNPLTARVIVNRLWQHHFGRGVVAAPSDFGVQGEPPTHPELLDWLACELVERGWSLKAIHRLMVTSTTYRQGTALSAAALATDPENRLLWRMNRRRLEGETLRDALLAVSGVLNPKAGGPSVYPELPEEMGGAKKKAGWPVSVEPAERNRRSVYVFLKRNQRYPLFSVFDAPDSNETCACRFISTSAPQALMLLNSKLSLDVADTFAGRVLREAGSRPEPVVAHAYRLALGRSPSEEERRTLLAFLDRETSLHRTSQPEERAFRTAVANLCHALLNLNEFLYVD
jgi:Protein of unknown function (DUF1553)/Protein of unknown function (DUF1549)